MTRLWPISSDTCVVAAWPWLRPGYVAAIRRLHLQWGRPLPSGLPPFTDAAIRGYPQRVVRPTAQPRHALTVQKLCHLKERLSRVVPSLWDQRCVWAACTVAFYGGLRSSEYLFTGPGRGLRRQDVHITTASCEVRLGIQKTQQHGQPSWISLQPLTRAPCVASLSSRTPGMPSSRGAPHCSFCRTGPPQPAFPQCHAASGTRPRL